jgi:hypothetical protein
MAAVPMVKIALVVVEEEGEEEVVGGMVHAPTKTKRTVEADVLT